jgi:hypothetical protein
MLNTFAILLCDVAHSQRKCNVATHSKSVNLNVICGKDFRKMFANKHDLVKFFSQNSVIAILPI